MATQTLDKVAQVPEDTTCRHYWVLKSPMGEVSQGVCKYCRKVRGFKNATEDFVWQEERAADLAYWGAGDVSTLLRNEMSMS